MKKLLPYLAFSLLLVVTFLSCEEEPHLELDSPETITEVPRSSFNSRSYVNMDDIPEVIGSLEKRMGSKVSKSGLGLGNKISAKDYEVFLDSIAQVANEGSNTNYTFALDVKGAGPNEFYNLVVGKTPDGEIKDPIVVRYALEQEDMDYFLNGGTDLKRLNAKYSYYNFERFFDENLKMTASGTGDCGSGFIGGGSGGGPTVPPGGSIQTSGFGVTVTTNFQTGHVTTVPYDFNISVTDENGNTEVNSGQAYSQNLDGVFATNYGQQDIDPIVLPPETATFNQDNKATQDQNGTINLGCTSSSHLDGAGWHINGCEESGTGQHNKGSVTAKEGDCEIPEGTMATLTTFTLMILNKTSGYIGLNLANPVDWSRYLWLSHRVIPVCIPINQFVEGHGQSNEAKLLSNELQQFMMSDSLDDFEQEYRTQMSSSEMAIFDSLSFFEQTAYLFNAQKATWKAEALYPNSFYNGKGDAFRHAYFNALNSILLGVTLAEDLATAHEDKPAPPNYTNYFKEVQMDLFNNQVGRTKKDWLSDGYQSLAESILDAMVNGELRYLSNLQGGGVSGRATNQSQLIPTN